MTKIYGVDLDKPITPLMVREALVECFFLAHCADSNLAEQVGRGDIDGRDYCVRVVEKAFADSGGDFDNPTKAGIVAAICKLKEFSANFRDPSLVEKHAAEIMQLVERLED